VYLCVCVLEYGCGMAAIVIDWDRQHWHPPVGPFKNNIVPGYVPRSAGHCDDTKMLIKQVSTPQKQCEKCVSVVTLPVLLILTSILYQEIILCCCWAVLVYERSFRAAKYFVV